MSGKKAKKEREQTKIGVRLAEIFNGIETRRATHISYETTTIIFIVILALAENQFGWAAFADVIKNQCCFIKESLNITELPSAHTVRRCVLLFDSEKLAECMMNWAASCGKIPDFSTIAIDGKHIRSAFKHCQGKNGIHVVSAYATFLKITLCQIVTNTKDAEIKIIPKILEYLCIEDKIITIDAAGSYKQIVEIIVRKNGHYVLAVKKNQKLTFEAIEKLFSKNMHSMYARFPEIAKSKKALDGYYHQSYDKGHGRVESRLVVQLPIEYIMDLDIIDKWSNAKTVVCVESIRMKNGLPFQSWERRYYITDLPLEPEKVSDVIRAHWGIEMMHWQLDVTFLEDLSQISDKRAIKNLGIFRRYVLNTYAQYPDYKKTFIPNFIRKFIFGNDKEFMLNIICGVRIK